MSFESAGHSKDFLQGLLWLVWNGGPAHLPAAAALSLEEAWNQARQLEAGCKVELCLFSGIQCSGKKSNVLFSLKFFFKLGKNREVGFIFFMRKLKKNPTHTDCLEGMRKNEQGRRLLSLFIENRFFSCSIFWSWSPFPSSYQILFTFPLTPNHTFSFFFSLENKQVSKNSKIKWDKKQKQTKQANKWEKCQRKDISNTEDAELHTFVYTENPLPCGHP